MKEVLKQKTILAQLCDLIFDFKVPIENIDLIDTFYSYEGIPINAISYLAGETLIILVNSVEDSNVFGGPVDIMMSYAAEISSHILDRLGLDFNNAKIALLINNAPFGISKRSYKYELDRFSPVKGPNPEDLKLFKLPETYLIIDLNENPTVKEDFFEILRLNENKAD